MNFLLFSLNDPVFLFCFGCSTWLHDSVFSCRICDRKKSGHRIQKERMQSAPSFLSFHVFVRLHKSEEQTAKNR